MSVDRMKEQTMLREAKRKSSCLQSKMLERFVEEGRLNLQLSHGWQGVMIAPSPTAQCCLGADNRQNKANVEPFLPVARRAQHDQIASWQLHHLELAFSCYFSLNLRCQLNQPLTEGSDLLNMQEWGWLSGLVLLNLDHNFHILTGRRY